MQSKYFTPEIEDIRVGYEGEFNVGGFWGKLYVSSADTIKEIVQNGFKLRTPYLTKEQIEAEGWKHRESTSIFIKGELGLAYNFDTQQMSIGYENGKTVFIGKCKCINDLRYITKLL